MTLRRPAHALLWALPAGLGIWLSCAGTAGAREALLGSQEVNSVKAVVAGAGTLVLALHALLGRRDGAPRARRPLDALLLLLGLLGAACWWNLFQFNYPAFGHPSETYHYYVGAKYFPELGYERLYRCTAIADAEAGLGDRVARRMIRNLATNDLEPAAPVLADPGACTRHFSAERWRDFQRDVAWFRGRLPQRRWHQTQTDHGYNGTPVWGLFGSLLAHTGPASDGQILALRLADPLLLLVTWTAVGWTFGWRTLCVALLYWGTNYPAQYGWVGGSYLRQLEFAAVLLGICLMRRDRMTAAGFLLALAALVRVYPALLLAGPALAAGGRMLRERRLVLSRSLGRLALGGGLALGTLLPAAALGTGGFEAWPRFVENSRVLLGTPLRNHMGLRTVLSHAPDAPARKVMDTKLDDPYAPWKEARQAAFERRRIVFAVLVAAFLVLLAVSVQRQPEWLTAVLGIGLVPVATELTCYYTALVVAFALLWRRHPTIGVALCGLAALGWALVERLHFFDLIFVWISLATVAFVVFATLGVLLGRVASRERDSEDGAEPRVSPAPPRGG